MLSVMEKNAKRVTDRSGAVTVPVARAASDRQTADMWRKPLGTSIAAQHYRASVATWHWKRKGTVQQRKGNVSPSETTGPRMAATDSKSSERRQPEDGEGAKSQDAGQDRVLNTVELGHDGDDNTVDRHTVAGTDAAALPYNSDDGIRADQLTNKINILLKYR
ncbi:Hypothetical protein CINCED_3A013970 [Cinara cedri]|uniref:Uncharacterized protein n=1 Tax=Cinara cedri TaxID=506608 RepID=A0A5E4MZF3_9HEMI|nr:Hypothetical protein CINCED_3A013970 [Cinara cedri]